MSTGDWSPVAGGTLKPFQIQYIEAGHRVVIDRDSDDSFLDPAPDERYQPGGLSLQEAVALLGIETIPMDIPGRS